MKNLKLNRLLMLLIALVTMSINLWAKSVTFTPGTDDTSTPKDGVSISMSNTTGSSGYYQAYASSDMVVSSTNGNITSISFTCTASGTSKHGPGNFSTKTGTYSYDGYAGSWSGSASSVTLSASAQVRMYAITITYSGGSTYTDYITECSSSPTLGVSPASLSGFTYDYGSGPSTAKSFTLSGSNLTNSVTVTGSTNYEVCKTEAGSYSNTLTYTTGEMASSQTVYVRLKAGLNVGDYNSENISITSDGAEPKSVAVSGSVASQKFVLTVTTDGNGTTISGTKLVQGATKELTATGNTGYEFDRWEIVSGTGAVLTKTTASPTTFTMGTSDATVKAYFRPIKVSQITLTATELVKKTTDGFIDFTATVTPSTALDKEIEWSSDDENVAVYVDGYIYFVGEGHCTITATAHDGGGATATCDVTVQSGTIALKLNNCGSVTDLGSVAWPYALPASQEPTCDDGWMFVGWTASPIGAPTNVEPTLVSEASVAGTYYAVYAKLGGSQSSTTFERVTDLGQLRDGRDIVITTDQSGGSTLLWASSGIDKTTQISVAATISNPQSTAIWQLEKSSTSWILKKNSTDKLVATGTSSPSYSYNTTGTTWTITESNDYLYFKNSSGNYLEHYSNKWVMYGTYNAGNLRLICYVRQNSYENYTTNPCVCAYGLVTSSNNGSSWENGGCFTQVGETTEWQLENVTLAANNENNRIKVQKDGADISGKTQSWQTGWIPFAGLQGTAATYKTLGGGADGAVGTLRIYSDNEADNANKYLAIIPTYQITHGVDGDAWGSVPFAWVEGSKYETEVQTAPAGYFSNGNYKYYVGVKNSSNTTNFIPNISETLSLNGMGGLNTNREGQRGKWRMYDNSTDRNWYVSWIPYYTITYKSYDGETTLYTDEVEGSVATNLRAAYNAESNGWATAPNSNTQNYAGGAEVTPSDNMVLYVSLKAYNVEYALAGGSNGCSNTTAIAGETVNICASTPEKAGNVFKGWKRSDNSEIVGVSGSFTMPAASVTLTAQWAAAHAITYTIPTGGGTIAVGAPASVEDNTTFTMPGVTGIAAEYECETLIGWTTNSTAYENTDGVKPTPFYAVGGTSPTITGPTTFYAVYSRPGLGASGTVGLTQQEISGNWCTSTTASTYGNKKTYTNTAGEWVATGYTQNNGNYVQLKADGSPYLMIPTLGGVIRTIVITHNSNSSARNVLFGSSAGAGIETSIPSSQTETTIDAEAAGLAGGYISTSGSYTLQIKSVSVTYGASPVISTTLSCDNSIDQFSITYDANTAQFSGSSVTCTNVNNYKFSENGGSYTICSDVSYTEDGATFLCWNNQPDGQGSISYEAGQEITSISDDNLTLYAQWAYNVNKSDNGSGAVVHPETVGGYVVLPDGEEVCDPKKYDFIGWTTVATASWDNNIFAPALIAKVAGECRYTPAEPNTTVFAVYAQSTAVGSQAFYIGYEADGHDYYMKSNLKVSAQDATAEACSYYLEDVNPSNNEYQLYYVDGGVKTYVYYTGSSLSTTTTSNASNAWVITNDGDVYIFQSKTNSGRYLSYSSGSFTTHVAANRQDLKIYSGAPAYKYLARTTCTDEATVIYRSGGGSITPIKTSEVVHIGESVTLPTCEYTGWTFRGWVDHAVNEATDEAIADANIYTGTYEVSGNVTLYAYYTRTPDPDSFDGTESGEYKMYYNAGGGTYRYADAQTTSSGTTGEYQTFTRCSLGETWLFTNVATNTYTIQAENGKYLQGISTENNDLTLGNDPMFWTVAKQPNGTWRIMSAATDNRVLGFLTGLNPHLENLITSQLDNATYTLPLLGTCVDPIYTTNPGTQKSMHLNGNVKVTSTQGVSVWGATKLTLGLEGMTPYTNVSITATDGFTFLKEDGSAWAGTQTEADGSLDVQVTVVYTPTSYNLNGVNPTITVTCGGEEAEFTDLITGRSLPEKFVIAQQIGGEWYALPNEMSNNYTSSTAALKMKYNSTEDRYEVPATTDGQYAYSLLAGKKTKSSLVFSSPMKSGNIIKVHGTKGNGAIGLYAQGGWNSTTTGDYYEFVPTSTDLNDYKLQNPYQEAYLGITDGNWGIGAETNVRFFEYVTAPVHTLTLIKGEDECRQVIENIPEGSVVDVELEDRCIPDGYHFLSWTVDAGGVTLGSNTANPTSFTMGDADVRITANYAPNEYTITYVNAVNGVDNVVNSNPSTYTIETATFTLTNPTKTGYVFGGWYENSEFNTPATTEIALGSTGNKTFYAKWDNGSTAITLGKNTSSSATANGSATATYASGSLGGFTPVADYSGYEVTGYFINTTTGAMVITRDGNLVSGVAGYTDESGNWIYTGATLTLYAKWQNKTYHVYYEMNGGTNNPGNISEYTYASSGSFALLEPTASTGYVFDKWTALGGSTKEVTTISYSVAADQTFVANWTGIKYRVDFDNQGATTTGTTYKENVQFGSAMPPIIVPTKLNHEFGGYFSETGGNGTKYYNADGSSAQNWDIAANTTLYAYWIPAKMLMDKNIIRVTSYKDEHVTSYQTITITSDYFATEPDITITEIGRSTSAPNPWLQGKVLRKTYSDHHLEAVIAVDYYPRAYDVTDENIMEITIGGETGHFNVIGRALPETFVIATQIAGQWYVLPSNMSGANTYAGTTVAAKPTAADPTSANASENFGYKMKQEYNYASGAHQEAVRLYSMLTGNNALWASTGVNISNNAQLSSASSDQYEWVLKSEDLVTYQLHNINRDADLKYSNQYKKWGMYAAGTDFNNVRLLSRNDVKDLNAKVMEWGTDAILLSYTGGATTMNAYVDGESVQEGLTLTNLGGDQYRLNAVNLDAHPTGLLTLSATESAVEKELTLQIPIMVDGEKASNNALFTDLGDACQFSEVVVLNGGVLTAATSGQNKVGNLTVYPGGKLSIPSGQTYTVNTLTMRGGYSELEGIYDVPQAYVEGGLTRSNMAASINYELTLDEKQYYDLALPFATDMANVTDETGNGDFNVWMKVYDGQTRTTGATGWTWYDWSGPTYPVTPGNGYLIASEPTTSGRRHRILRFPMTVSSMTSGGEPEKAPIPVTAYGFTAGTLNEGVRANNAGWNFIANPYMANYGKDAEAYEGRIQVGELVQEIVDGNWTGGYVWDATGAKNIRYVTTYDNGEYTQHPMSTTSLKPFTGFFIQVSQSGSVKFTQDGRQNNVAARSMSQNELPSEVELILTISKGTETDNTVLLLGNDWSRADNKEIPDDQSKLMEGTSLKLYTIEDEEKMYANAMKVAEAETWIPVGVRAKEDGEYRFTYENTQDWQYVDQCILWDMDRNETVDLKSVEEYVVNLEAGDHTGRFALNVVMNKAPQTPTDISGGGGDRGRNIRKVIFNDKLYIIVDGKVYDATGKTVK